MRDLADLKTQSEGLFNKIRGFLKQFADKIRALYKKISPETAEGKFITESKDAVEQLEKLFANALKVSAENYAASEKVEGAESTPSDSARMSFRSSQSGMANDALIPYDSELSQLIETKGDYIVDSYEKLEKIVKLAFDEPDHKATVYFGIIDATTLKNIENSVPNIPRELDGTLFKANKDYSIATTLDSIRHIVDEKGLTIDEVIDYLDRMPDTILDRDSVNFDYYYQGGTRIPGLLFKKTFSDGTITSFNLVTHQRRLLRLQSIYFDTVSYQKKKAAKTLLMPNASAHTSKTQVGQPSTTKIPQTPSVVKTQTANSSPNGKNSTALGENDMQSLRTTERSTMREVLADALDEIAETEADKKALANYKKKVAEADGYDRTLAELQAKREALYADGIMLSLQMSKRRYYQVLGEVLDKFRLLLPQVLEKN